MFNRRDFLKTAVLGGAAFGVGLKLGDALHAGSGQRVVLHGFLPADQKLLGETLGTFLALESGRLPAPTLDAAPAWRAAAAGALRTGADRYVRDGKRMFTVQVTALDGDLPADLMLQQGSRVLDPRSGFGAGLLRLRERLQGRQAQVMVSCRLEDRPGRLAENRVLVVETERGVQDRIALDGQARRLDLHGPAGRTAVTVDQRGVHVAAASCRHATCRRQGVIARPGELIACAPNRLVLRVETA
jgi:hypothetical protein